MPTFIANGELHYFAHIPKCAGTTIEEHLTARFGPLGLIGQKPDSPVSLQHLTWDDLSTLLSDEKVASSFGIVRHPFDRFVSAYNMRIAQPKPPFPREITLNDFLDWAENRLGQHPALLDNHLRPQVEFLGPQTRVFHLEDGLEAVIAFLDEAHGPSSGLPPLGHHDYSHAETSDLFETSRKLPAKLAARLAKFYNADFTAFGYDPDPARPVKIKVLKQEHIQAGRRKLWLMRQIAARFIPTKGPNS